MMKYIANLFGIVGLLITIGSIFSFVSWQVEQFGLGGGEGVPDDVRAGRIGDPADMIDSIDRAEDAARAIEVRNRIETQFGVE